MALTEAERRELREEAARRAGAAAKDGQARDAAVLLNELRQMRQRIEDEEARLDLLRLALETAGEASAVRLTGLPGSTTPGDPAGEAALRRMLLTEELLLGASLQEKRRAAAQSLLRGVYICLGRLRGQQGELLRLVYLEGVSALDASRQLGYSDCWGHKTAPRALRTFAVYLPELTRLSRDLLSMMGLGNDPVMTGCRPEEW